AVILEGEVECDEVYVVAGHKGQPEAVKKKGRKSRRNRLKGARGRGTLEKEKPPIFGMVQRGGQVVIHMLENVQQATIKPFIQSTIAPGTLIYTDE
ncbi:MAG: transposase, partial [Methylobacter sp.]|nr:transposase [Methylobacter sp.]